MAWLGAQNAGKALKNVAVAANGDPASAVKQRRPVGELSMYAKAPEGEVAIEEFERFALDRLRGEHADLRLSRWLTLNTYVPVF